jgi:hypothetical protein
VWQWTGCGVACVFLILGSLGAMMAAFSLIPTSLLFIPLVLVLFALPALLPRFQRP